ncbi:kinesin-like protein KIF18B [Rhinatrema bivittatum]|uniref:kinesin-like protein KIF18B n=1 Tax=Rhinatrema bivittatum TaxID=194408 RepID=UPI00112CE604|nr:kinesin-like protein KIF18B [Rhinatrema bivittatum]XP_029441345.1 kinesin-like protein KIF18B [Rhinatrema bivittatum]XP_029441346.1 kinesin-like protein KIF18B [Rhinatrema bivittatum]XP_029441347.1 kinesin-like protein KIF18B [Rhinatrema bivittatum]
MAAAAEEGNVSVVVRVRPLGQEAQEGSQYRVVQVLDPSVLVLDPEEPDSGRAAAGFRVQEVPRRRARELTFVFDRVFGEAAGQQEIFQHLTKDILDGVLNGYNCSVFAYGATGAGKTHTMLGDEQDPGIMYLAMMELYRRLEGLKEDKRCAVQVSYLEVYNEQIQDLLELKGPLAIREDPEKGVVVQGLSFHQPDSAQHLLHMLARGNRNRTQHPTDANAVSSRSHAVFQIYVKLRDRVAGISQDVQVSKMSLIDLAGSERASSTNARGERLREGANINRSLLALINVINALADAKNRKSHVPYRDSKLTRLLKDSLGGNCRTVMIAAVCPSSRSYDDTYNTLRYANRAKQIKMSLKSNTISVECHMSKYAAVCEELKAEVMALRAKLKVYESGQGPADPGRDPPAQTCFRLGEPRSEAIPGCENKMGCWEPTGCFADQARPGPLGAGARETRSLESRGSFLFSESERVDLSPALRGLDCIQTERLFCALLSMVRRQHCALEVAGLCAPEMALEMAEVERLLQSDGTTRQEERKAQDARTLLEKPSKSIPETVKLQRVSPTACTAPRRPPQKRGRREALVNLSPSPNTPVAPLKKRRRSETSTPSGAGYPATAKRQKKSALPSKGAPGQCVPVLISERATSGSGSFPVVRATQPLETASPCTPKLGAQGAPTFCSSTVTKRRMPLATSALQNSASVKKMSAVVQNMNATFDLSEDGLDRARTFDPLAFSCWKSVGCSLKEAASTFPLRDKTVVFGTQSPASRLRASAPQPFSSISRCSTQKRLRSVSTLAGPHSRIARLQNSTMRRHQYPAANTERSSCSPKWQSTKRASARRPMQREPPAESVCQPPEFAAVISS